MAVAERYYSCPHCRSKTPSGIETMLCSECETIFCRKCGTGSSKCPCCGSLRNEATCFVYKEQEQKRLNARYKPSSDSSSNDSSDYSESGTASNYHPITDATGQGFLLFSCILAIWLLPAMIALWVFITVWYLFYKIFGIKRRPFDESYWVGAGAICLALIGGAIVGGICSLFLGPFGVLIGLAIFIGILNTYD